MQHHGMIKLSVLANKFPSHQLHLALDSAIGKGTPANQSVTPRQHVHFIGYLSHQVVNPRPNSTPFIVYQLSPSIQAPCIDFAKAWRSGRVGFVN